MITNHSLDDILFIDVETVPQQPNFEELDDDFKNLWDKKSSFFREDEETPEDVYQRAGIYAEFGKIICISVGHFVLKEKKQFRVTSFYGDDEKELLAKFITVLESWSKNKKRQICGHNIKEFDVPYIARRILINGLALPQMLNVAGLKPWEVQFIDTLELWKFGDYKNYTSLELLTKIFNIPTPKDDIDGSQVASVYYDDKDLERIVTYCEKDVVATAQLFLRFRGEELISEEDLIKISLSSSD